MTEELELPAYAPCAGSSYDLEKGEWIRLTEPVYRKKKNEKKKAEKKKEKDEYGKLMEAVKALMGYAASLKNHSNGEIRSLTERIRDLID